MKPAFYFRVVVVAIFAGLTASLLQAGQTQGRIPIEAAMRALQERSQATGGFAYWWPNSEQVEPGAYPKDNFYGDDAKDPVLAAQLVTNLYYEAQNVLSQYVKPGSGPGSGDGQFHFLSEDIPTDVPFDDSWNIAQDSYINVFNQLVALINQANTPYIFVGFTSDNILHYDWFDYFNPPGDDTAGGAVNGPSPTFSSTDVTATAYQDWLSGRLTGDAIYINHALTNGWEFDSRPWLRQEFECDLTYLHPNTPGDQTLGYYTQSALYTRRGRWQADLTHIPGTADVYEVRDSRVSIGNFALLDFYYSFYDDRFPHEDTTHQVKLLARVAGGQQMTLTAGATDNDAKEFSYIDATMSKYGIQPPPTDLSGASILGVRRIIAFNAFAIGHATFKYTAEPGPVPDDSCPACAAGGDGQCAAGATDATNQCVDVKIRLGQGPDGPAGYFWLHNETPSPALVSPVSLIPRLQRGVTVQTDPTLTNSVGSAVIRQVVAPQAFVDIVTLDAFAYEIRFYTAGSQGQLAADGFYHPSGTPYRIVRIEDPDRIPGQLQRVLVTVSEGSPIETDEYDFDAATQAWRQTSKRLGATRVDIRTVTIDSQTGNRTELVKVQGANGTVVSSQKRVFATFPWNAGGTSLNAQELIEDTIDPDGLAQKTTYQYYTDATNDGPNYTRVKLKVEPSGFWTQFEYDDTGKVSKETTPFGNSQPGATTNVRVKTTDRSAGFPNEIIVDTVVLANGATQEVGRSYRIFDYDQIRTIKCQTAGASWDAPDNLVTTEATVPEFSWGDEIFWGRIQKVLRPDGTGAFYTYAKDGDRITTTIQDGAVDSSGSIVTDGKQTVQVTDATGQLISEQISDIATGLTLSSSTATAFDSLGRVTTMSYSDGTTEQRSYGCCGLEVLIDRQGIRTDYVRDGWGRVLAATTAGITTSYTYDAVGRQTSVTRIGSDGTSMPISATVYDATGEALSTTAFGLRTTQFAKTYDTNGQTIRTTTNPDGGTKIETYAIDGSLQSVAGTAAFPLQYQYGADSNGAFTKEIKVGSQGETAEWTQTYTDIAGRAYKTVFADGASTLRTFNALGQMVSQVDADGVTTLFSYNDLGQAELSAIDLNGNGQIDLDGTDRATRRHHEFVSAHGTTVDRTTTTVWTPDGANDVLIEDVSVDGMHSWRTELGLITQGQIAYDGAGGRTETTTTPDGVVRQNTYVANRLASTTIKAANLGALASVTYTYDPHGRLTAEIDARTGTKTYTYFGDDQLKSVTTPDPDPARTGDGYDPQTTAFGYDAAGRRNVVTQSDGTTTSTTYYLTGQIQQVSGARVYPQRFTYDAQGRTKTLTTWQDFAGNAGKAVTTWNYDPQRGTMVGKQYADGKGPSYTYTPAGRLKTRVWARGITTTYGYNAAGDLISTSYSNGEPSVTFGYDNLGRLTTIADAAGACMYTYQGLSSAIASESHTGGILDQVTLNRGFDPLNRLNGLSLQTASTGAPVYSVGYAYDDGSRLQTVTSGSNTATYAYVPNSGLVQSITFANGGVTKLTTTKTYDNLNRLTSIVNALSAQPSALSYAYTYNSANQRTQVTREDAAAWKYGYDALGQLTTAAKYNADQSAALGLNYGYTYDDIGNRRTTTTNAAQSNYSANLLNQYDQRTVPGVVDVAGSADPTATVSVNLTRAQRQNDQFYVAVPVDNTAGPAYATLTTTGVKNNVGPNGEDALAKDTRQAFLPKNPEIFTYDADGNLLSDGRWQYTWNAENRLTAMETLPVVASFYPQLKQRLEFAYDAFGRRLEKKVYAWNVTASTYQPSTDLRFAYDGWNLVAELNAGGTATTIIRSYVRGSDLSGEMQGAGGIEGLLFGTFGGTSAAYAYDGNGNVAGLADTATGAVSAVYEYDSFGRLLTSGGSLAPTNPFRFSSQYFDTESALISYSQRYYSPETGRWLSRDPSEEFGSHNLYRFVSNDPQDQIDVLGMYERAGHGFTSFYTYRSAGWPADSAFRIAYYTQLPDLVPQFDAYSLYLATQFPQENAEIRKQILNYIGPSRNIETWAADIFNFIHSLHGGNNEEVWRRRKCLAELLKDGTLLPWERGFVGHGFGDSYAHTSGGFGSETAYGPYPNGHGPQSILGILGLPADPDVIGNDLAKYNRYVRAMYGVVKRNGNSGIPIDEPLYLINNQLPSYSPLEPYYLSNLVNQRSFGFNSGYMMDRTLDQSVYPIPSADEVERLIKKIKEHCCVK